MKTTFNLAAMITLGATAASADPFTDQIVSAYRDAGYQYIEIETDGDVVEVEATANGLTTEVVYDRATGAIVERKVRNADDDDANRSGVEIREREEEFEDDDDDDQGRDDDDDDDDDNDDDDDDDNDRDDDDDNDDDDQDEDDDDDDDDEGEDD